MSDTPESKHAKAAARHAKKRAEKKPAKKKSVRKGRVRQAPLESFPNIDLTAKERMEVSQARELVTKADIQAALQRPSELTPLQLKRLAYSEAKKAAIRAKRASNQTPSETPEADR